MTAEMQPGSGDTLDNHRLLRKLARPVPYGPGSVFFNLVLNNPLTQRVLKGKLGVLRRVRQSLGMPPLTTAQSASFLMVNFTMYWRLHALARLSLPKLEKVMRVEGEDILKEHYGKRGIVLANSHYGAGKSIPVLLARKGYDLASVDRLDVFSELKWPEGSGTIDSIELGKKDNDFVLKSVFRMKKCLKKKSLMHIAADGFRGATGPYYDFLGKPRQIPQSFAEMAVATDSVVIPVISRLYPNGDIKIRFSQPIDPRGLEGDDSSKKDQICALYLAGLQKEWLSGLEFVFNHDLAMYHRMEGQACVNTVPEAVSV